jgi:hypothetical protein
MYGPTLLFLLSVTAAALGHVLTGSPESPVVLVSMLSAVAALLLWLRAAVARLKADERAVTRRGVTQSGRPIVIDGSNVMHWQGQVPSLAPVAEVVNALIAQGFRPGVVFDANAGYKLVGRYMDDGPLASALGLPADRVLVVPRGKPADPVILETARHLGAPILSNDRFRDWAETFPEVRDQRLLRRGGYRDGVLWLEAS